MTVAHPLDRPIWSALTGPQAALARGGKQAWRIDPAIGWFAAAADPGDIATVTALIDGASPLVLFEDVAATPMPAWNVRSDTMVQMVADRLDAPAAGPAIEPLGAHDEPAMLALATLTQPGPFLAGTPRFGGFVGIRAQGELVAMAGTRLRVPGFVEISGVCTHPEHRGQGHAARLMQTVAGAIVAAGAKPFLHAYAANKGAVALYERLGFGVRRELIVSFVTPA